MYIITKNKTTNKETEILKKNLKRQIKNDGDSVSIGLFMVVS
jgi:hypothetical protein